MLFFYKILGYSSALSREDKSLCLTSHNSQPIKAKSDLQNQTEIPEYKRYVLLNNTTKANKMVLSITVQIIEHRILIFSTKIGNSSIVIAPPVQHKIDVESTSTNSNHKRHSS
jgi:hypothetical protein